ncbi:hypothetical protein FM112_14325 [Gulosibacter sp. 10]|nr:hypothetical protein FM112_14325 [Gulosibacter sp. 10]
MLRDMLERLGVAFDPAAHSATGVDWRSVGFEWPEGLHVVQVGDLVHRGPDSLGVVLLVDRLLARGVWTQLVGNHEQLYVDRRVFDWAETVEAAASEALRAWWGEGWMVPGAAVEAADGDWLLTHGGLTRGFWEQGLWRPSRARDALAPLAEARADGALWFPGSMLTGRADENAGPVWAEAGVEVYPSWKRAETPMPFHQAHGHSTAFLWDREQWRAERWILPDLSLDVASRHVTFTNGDRRIVGIDPGHGRAPAPAWAPLILRDARVHT